MVHNYRRFENESEDEVIWRIGQDKDVIGTWQNVANILNDLLNYDYGESTYRKKIQAFQKIFQANQSKFIDCNAQLEEIKFATEKSIKERMKLQTEKLEYSRWRREESRDEMVLESIVESVKNLEPLDIPELIGYNLNPKSWVLAYGDTHVGAEFEIRGLFNQIINSYSPEEFEIRMWRLCSKVKEIVYKESIDILNVWDFSDSIDGLLRVSQLMKLRFGVVDQTIYYANFISNWLNEISRFVNIKFQMVVDANHSQLRMIGQPKNAFKDDNMSKVIIAFIKERLKDNKNIEIVENPTGMIFDTLCNYNFLGIHGEVKNMKSAIREFSAIHGVTLNYLIGGHLHHHRQEEIGFDTEVINIPSIIGIDDFSMSLNTSSNSGAKMLCFEENMGKTIEYSIKLN